jgi:predicted peptidase
MQTEHKFENLSYLLHIPKSLEHQSDRKWPLIFFLHGAGERGDNLDLVKIHGVAKIVDNQEDFPFIVVSPQCPTDSYWPQELDTLNALLDKIIADNPVDTNRIYLTGLSMGGIGSWQLALAHPDKFAAIAPICGAISIPVLRRNEFELSTTTKELYARLPLLKDVPVWAFHGDQDDIVPMDETEEIIQLLNNAGGDAKLTVYEGVGHDSWTETYDNPKLYEWFLQHHQKN